MLGVEEARELGGAAVADLEGGDLRTAEDMLAAGLDVRLDAGAPDDPVGNARDIVEEEDFATWMQLRDLDLASHLLAFWRELDIGAHGDLVHSLKENDAETPVCFFRKVKEDLARRDWLEDGEVTVRSLARWCREVVGGRFADDVDFVDLEELVEYMRVELKIVQEQSASLRGSCALEGEADGLDPDEAARQAAGEDGLQLAQD